MTGDTVARTCPNCGASVVEGDSFCGTCGEFLDWEADPTSRTVASPRRQADPAGERPAGSAGERPAGSAGERPAELAGERSAELAAERSADSAGERPAESGVTAPGGRPEASPVVAPARSPVGAPGEGPVGASVEQPGEVLPGRPVAARPVVREFAVDAAAPDDVICPACGAGNGRGRRFCRRCGRALGETGDAAVGQPWWRRLGRLRARLGLVGLLLRLAVVLAVLAIVVAAGYAVMVYGPRAVEAVRDRTAKPEQIRPVTVMASSEAPGHPAADAVDGLTNRFWAPAAAGEADGQYLEMTFEKPIRLLDVIVYPGASARPEQFESQARPAVLDMTTWTSGGATATTSLRLADQPGEQQFHRAVGSVTRLRFTIRSSYGVGGDRRSAVAEIELFRRP